MKPQRLLQDEITEHMIAEKRGQAGWITFNDPARHNAVSLDMWAAIPKILDTFAADDEVRAVVLTGAGEKAFISGANISQFDSLRSGQAHVDNYEVVAEAAQLAIYDFQKPIIAKIRGYCIGGGLNIALCCDVRFAAKNAIFSIPAARLGLGYRLTAIKNLVMAAGGANALDIFISARKFDAAAAKEKNIVQYVVDTESLDDAVQDYLNAICANAPLTMMAGKKMIKAFQKLAPDIDTEAMKALVNQCFSSDDYREGKRAFAEKRAPVFQGR